MSRRVADGAITASPAATVRMADTRSAARASLSRKPLAPARSVDVLVQVEGGQAWLGPRARPGSARGPAGGAWPVVGSRRRSGAGAGKGFGQFDHVAPRVAEECEPAADGLDLERFA